MTPSKMVIKWDEAQELYDYGIDILTEEEQMLMIESDYAK